MTATTISNQEGYNSIPISVEDAAKSLGSFRRRLVIMLTAEHNRSLTTGELAEAIAAIETDQPMDQLNSQERKRVYVSLYQHHLKTLDETGAIEYDNRAKHVSNTNATKGLAKIIHQLNWVCEI